MPIAGARSLLCLVILLKDLSVPCWWPCGDNLGVCGVGLGAVEPSGSVAQRHSAQQPCSALSPPHGCVLSLELLLWEPWGHSSEGQVQLARHPSCPPALVLATVGL